MLKTGVMVLSTAAFLKCVGAKDRGRTLVVRMAALRKMARALNNLEGLGIVAAIIAISRKKRIKVL